MKFENGTVPETVDIFVSEMCVPPTFWTVISGRVAMLRMTGQLVARDLVRTCKSDELRFVKMWAAKRDVGQSEFANKVV